MREIINFDQIFGSLDYKSIEESCLIIYFSDLLKEMDVWTLTPLACQVDVQGNKVKELEQFCVMNNINFKVVIEDLSETIRLHMQQDAPNSFRSAKSPRSRARANNKAPFVYEQYNRYEDVSI